MQSSQCMFRFHEEIPAGLGPDVPAAGVKAFDELEKVVEKLGDDYGKGFTWAKVQKEKLQLAKRYLKADYKVRVFCECISYSLMKEKISVISCCS